MGRDQDLFCNQCGCANPGYANFCRFCGHAISGLVSLGASSSPAVAVAEPQGAVLTQRVQIDQLLKQRYKIVRRVGQGGYGEVYAAVDTEFMERRVAVKEMIQQGLNAQELLDAIEGFKREATLLATLTHPNLPSIYDYFSEQGNWYLVMSYIDGETLESYTRQRGGSLPIEKVLQIGIQLAAVLSFLHTRKPSIIFRDLKPSNIMRTPEGQIYLIDFGIARHFKPGQRKDTFILGSPGYAAPEQYGRMQTTPQSDVYSLGALLHHLLTGIDPSQHPFRYQELDLPEYPQLSILIHCMVEMDPKKRPVNMGNIQRELQRIAMGRVHYMAQTSKRPLVLRPASVQLSISNPQVPSNLPPAIPHPPSAVHTPPYFPHSRSPLRRIWSGVNNLSRRILARP
ncbi:serine/threonine protein kinase [Dictyobacter arantiisoli]|uniref:Protein kinase domain-containing protein n=1 Tax=Dictyobacter arantiisoli TaxID=2014874 RepID=A0A5A5T9Z9_9CHLR|nr:serine/threonine-protein kinase [Dictyobacter arantiisoli]GCF08167.1 hypothetical protein KDI_17310 [Dictyobacter arantiisoli]